jgi:hypothetical protein
MRQVYPELEIEYFFTDTGKELPEVYAFLGKLEGFLGQPIAYLNPDRGFDFWLEEYKSFLPSPKTRWCTRQLKIRPFEKWLWPSLEAGDEVVSYVAIRADEDYREGYSSTHANLTVRLPFREDRIDKAGVNEILEASGVGLPDYYAWRSRSGCFFCFYQQKIEWVRLKEVHPARFEDAKAYEKNALEHGSPFTWTAGESLEELERPDRVAAIHRDHERRLERLRARRVVNPLRPEEAPIDMDEIYGQAKGCVTCHK